MKNLLIVESQNDKFFINALINYLNISDTEVSQGYICEVNDYECLDGLSQVKLEITLKSIKNRLKKDDKIAKIGIIIDQDDKSKEQRLKLVNDAIHNTFNDDKELIDTCSFAEIKVDDFQSVKFATYFTNIGGSGELETVLKAIKKSDSTYADCLEVWRHCLESKSKPIKPKDFDKFWVNVYIRYDTCTKEEQKQAGRKCNNEASMQKDIWNFDDGSLAEMKRFLKLFSVNG